MNTSKTPFLVPGIGYIVLGLVAVVLGFYGTLLALGAAHGKQVGIEQFIWPATFGLIFALQAAFYVAIGIGILKRRWRMFVIVSAIISCIIAFPLGTMLGLVFLRWTRRQWPVSTITVQ